MSSHRGLSLLELLIALVVIGVALLGVVGACLQAVGSKDANREQQIAKTAATRKLEEIRTVASTNFSSVYATYQGSTFSVSGLTNTSNPNQKLGLGTVTVDAANPSLLDVRVRVDWQGVRGDSTYETRFLVTP